MSFIQEAGLVRSIVNEQSIAQQDRYTEPDFIYETLDVFYNEQYVGDQDKFSLDNSDRFWEISNFDPSSGPQNWVMDLELPKTIKLQPGTSNDGNAVIESSGGGFFGIISACAAGEDLDITCPTGLFGVISGEYVSQCYLGSEPALFGVVSEIVPGSRNITIVGTVIPELMDADAPTLETVIIGIPRSFKGYIKYATLTRIFGSDGELKDTTREKYCRARMTEGINLCKAVRNEILLDEPR